jgi:hypothetical protein
MHFSLSLIWRRKKMQKMHPRGKKCHTLWKPRNKSMVFPGFIRDHGMFFFMFLGVPRHYPRRSYSCWYTAWSRVCGRGLEDTDPTPVEEISWSKVVNGPRRPFTCWTEDQFVLTTSTGIRYQGVPKIVVRGHEYLFPIPRLGVELPVSLQILPRAMFSFFPHSCVGNILV